MLSSHGLTGDYLSKLIIRCAHLTRTRKCLTNPSTQTVAVWWSQELAKGSMAIIEILSYALLKASMISPLTLAVVQENMLIYEWLHMWKLHRTPCFWNSFRHRSMINKLLKLSTPPCHVMKGEILRSYLRIWVREKRISRCKYRIKSTTYMDIAAIPLRTKGQTRPTILGSMRKEHVPTVRSMCQTIALPLFIQTTWSTSCGLLLLANLKVEWRWGLCRVATRHLRTCRWKNLLSQRSLIFWPPEEKPTQFSAAHSTTIEPAFCCDHCLQNVLYWTDLQNSHGIVIGGRQDLSRLSECFPKSCARAYREEFSPNMASWFDEIYTFKFGVWNRFLQSQWAAVQHILGLQLWAHVHPTADLGHSRCNYSASGSKTCSRLRQKSSLQRRWDLCYIFPQVFWHTYCRNGASRQKLQLHLSAALGLVKASSSIAFLARKSWEGIRTSKWVI